MTAETVDLASRAAELDATDPLSAHRTRFVPSPDVVAYFDGNSLGRPLAGMAERLDRFVTREWGGGLIRGWTGDGPADSRSARPWMDWPGWVGDRIAAAALGAAPGQTVVADSTTVLLYKLARAAVDAQARAGRREIVLDTDNFPTDRYVLEGIAAERGCVLRWIETDPAEGVTAEQVAAVVGPATGLVLFSHVAYRSGWLADAAAVTRVVHDAGGLVLWDLCHSAGSVELQLDAWGVDLAAGCTYKYLNGGPGSPAFGYVRRDLQDVLRQPIQGWMGRRDPFLMGPGYVPADGVRGVVSGTPPVLAMVPLLAALEQLEEAGIAAVRAKSVALTEFALELVDAWLVPYGVEVASPRDPARRGGHVTIRRPGFRELLPHLWERGVIPDFREPDGIRLGLAPLSTSFTEVHAGVSILRDVLTEHA
ncbi:kynureninase [Pseudonocardia alaniniphila]|uniref:Kynureninase n=1 Tax=Pseudonocardia alaniniphila TaxID=75291 RepID=A0ABS9TJ16_9PSEU|nr:aminotransferase class V-fold PLP-dependent enzyme [Pseudonocardia alaniniphila]MCH6168483.1 aminotransferase class V-fold PLP-dependent enzyme [Pseudonocardia alaniniphila]